MSPHSDEDIVEVDLLLALRSSKSTYTDAANNIVDVAHSSMPVLVGEWIILMELLNCNFVSSGTERKRRHLPSCLFIIFKNVQIGNILKYQITT